MSLKMYSNRKVGNFSHNTDLKLIRLVRENPVLYDHKHEKYMDFNSKEVAWQKIGDELKRAAAHCKMRWVNIRDVHRRLLRKTIQNPGKKITSYKYQNALQFMRPYYRDLIYIPENDTDNLEETVDYTGYEESNDNDYDSDNEQDETINNIIVKQEKIPKKRKKAAIIEETFETLNEPSDVDSSDPVDTFLKTIGATLKTFSAYRLNLAKTQIFSIVQEHDLQQIMHNQKCVGDESETL